MTYLLVFTFYNGDDMVGLDVKSFSQPVHPIEVMSMEIVAPSESDIAVVSCSPIDSDEVLWIEAFKMEACGGENN